MTETSLINRIDSEHSNFFIDMMMDYYGYCNDVLVDIVENRKIYEENGDQFPTEMELLKLFDLYKKYLNINKCISNSLLVHCYWYIYNNFQHDVPNFIETDEKGKDTVRKNLLADYLIKKYMIIYWKTIRYTFDNGKFSEDSNSIEREIESILREVGYSDKKFIVHLVNEIKSKISWRCDYKNEISPFNIHEGKLIPCNNCTITRLHKDILPNSPAFGFMYKIQADYDPSAPTEPIKKFISEIVDGEDQKLLIQVPAQALMQNANYQLSYLCTGDGANGKSTYIKLLKELVGIGSTTAVSLQEILENRFSTANLHGKLLNLYADLPKTSLKDTGKFKILTGGDQIGAEKKFKDSFLFENKSVFVFSANELPSVTDGTFAFWRRWAIIEFPHQFKVSNKYIDELITPKNLSGFLNLIIEDMNRIANEGIIRSSKAEEIMELWKMRSNSSYAFIKTRLQKSPRDAIPKNLIWAEYNKYCIDNDFTEMSKIRFKQELEREFAIEEKYEQKGRERQWIIRGISFIDLNAPKKKEITQNKVI
jgi:P4 family phage/plasmid primase-like protien